MTLDQNRSNGSDETEDAVSAVASPDSRATDASNAELRGDIQWRLITLDPTELVDEHPLVAKLPLDNVHVERLTKSIRESEQFEPINIVRDRSSGTRHIVDGRHRYAATRALNAPCHALEAFEDTLDDWAAWILARQSTSESQRMMNQDQRAAFAVLLYSDHIKSEARKRQTHGRKLDKHETGRWYVKAGAVANTTPHKVRQAAQLEQPALMSVLKNEISLVKALKLSGGKNPRKDKEGRASKGKPREPWPTATKPNYVATKTLPDTTDSIAESVDNCLLDCNELLVDATRPFRVIIADPWGAVMKDGNPLLEMDNAQLQKLSLNRATDGAIVFLLLAPSRFLEASDVLRSWGCVARGSCAITELSNTDSDAIFPAQHCLVFVGACGEVDPTAAEVSSWFAAGDDSMSAIMELQRRGALLTDGRVLQLFRSEVAHELEDVVFSLPCSLNKPAAIATPTLIQNRADEDLAVTRFDVTANQSQRLKSNFSDCSEANSDAQSVHAVVRTHQIPDLDDSDQHRQKPCY